MTRGISRRSALSGGIAAGVAVAVAKPATASAEIGYAFRHVTVVDVISGRLRPDMTVVVIGDRIVAVGRSQDIRVPPGVLIHDLPGKFLLPGLCDLHVHTGADVIDLPLHVANGVTTIRDMSTEPRHFEMRRRVEAGTLLGPRWVLGSRIIDGIPSLWDPNFANIVKVSGDADARAAVREAKAEGAEFIKVYTRVSPVSLNAIADESRKLGLPFLGHCPDSVPIETAVDLGQRSFEHLFWTFYGTSRKEAELVERLRNLDFTDGDYNSWFTAMHPIEWEAAHTHSPVKARALFAKFAACGARQVPTLALHNVLDHASAYRPEDDPLRKYLPKSALDLNDFVLREFYLKGRTPQTDAEWAALWELRLGLVGEMHRAGVQILAGTDVGTGEIYPGFALHEELQHLVTAGMSPMAALRSATIESAKFLGRERETGSVAPGKLADLVLLDADPLADIANTRKLHGVSLRGKYYDPAARQKMLDDVEKAAATMPADAVTVSLCPCHAGAH
ncbi:amidohydrolase family protein [Amycolatopsis sp. NPDC059657]|uniref:amidohydrolase family protein n=1 Tax=Amycolatopsis sp. NPDC059657 TaxID=3346899 RepID=UPI00366F5E2F